MDSDMNITGLYHLSSEAINKHYLLVKLKEVLGLDIEIEPYEEYHCDRSLDSTKLRNLMELTPPDWEEMHRKVDVVVGQEQLAGIVRINVRSLSDCS